MKHLRAGALPIESVELSRTGQLWGLNVFLTFRMDMTEWFWQREEFEMRWTGVGAIEPRVTFVSVFAEENGWRTQIRSHLIEGR